MADRARPVTLARERTLPLLAPLRPLLPDEALARGSTVGVAGNGATSLALALVAGPSQAGSWVAMVGLPELGLAAAEEAGVDLRRLALVPDPPTGQWATVVAALVGGVDLIVVDGRAALGTADGRRLAARVRERGSVLLAVEPGSLPRPSRSRAWPRDLTLTVTAGSWEGLGDGHGHLRRRRVEVEADGRGRSARPRRCELWLPGPGGAVAPVPGGRSSSSGSGDRQEERHAPAGTVVAFRSPEQVAG